MRLKPPDFSQRSQDLELMDDPDISAEEIWAVLAELDTINRLLGGYQITIDALSQFLAPGRQWHILDVGCGGGDNLRMIAQWAQKKGLDLKLTGLDLNPDCLA